MGPWTCSSCARTCSASAASSAPSRPSRSSQPTSAGCVFMAHAAQKMSRASSTLISKSQASMWRHSRRHDGQWRSSTNATPQTRCAGCKHRTRTHQCGYASMHGPIVPRRPMPSGSAGLRFVDSTRKSLVGSSLQGNVQPVHSEELVTAKNIVELRHGWPTDPPKTTHKPNFQLCPTTKSISLGSAWLPWRRRQRARWRRRSPRTMRR